MQTYRKAFLVYNPVAGGLRRRKPALERAIRLLSARGMAVEAIPTSGPGMATEIVRGAIARGAGLVLVAGGDGTINEAVNGMVYSDVPLGILPAGTANVLACELDIGATLERASESLDACVEERVAVGRLSRGADDTGRHFLLMAGVGLDAETIYRLNIRLKNALGKVAYWLGGFRNVGRRLPEFTVEAEGREFRVSFALASRVRNYGGDLEIAPTVSLLDDRFELVLFAGANSFAYLRYILGVVIRKHRGMRGVTILRTRKASFSAPEDSRIHLQVDGEYAGLLPAAVEIVPNALTLLVPPTFRDRRPVGVEDPAWITSPTR
ncbi:MAG TPA: diacylglycerol kinase family protein [Bryobacteraceae bacterium]